MYHLFKKFLNNILFFLSKTELVFKFVFFCVFTHDWVKLFFTLIFRPILIYFSECHITGFYIKRMFMIFSEHLKSFISCLGITNDCIFLSGFSCFLINHISCSNTYCIRSSSSRGITVDVRFILADRSHFILY